MGSGPTCDLIFIFIASITSLSPISICHHLLGSWGRASVWEFSGHMGQLVTRLFHDLPWSSREQGGVRGMWGYFLGCRTPGVVWTDRHAVLK